MSLSLTLPLSEGQIQDMLLVKISRTFIKTLTKLQYSRLHNVNVFHIYFEVMSPPFSLHY